MVDRPPPCGRNPPCTGLVARHPQVSPAVAAALAQGWWTVHHPLCFFLCHRSSSERSATAVWPPLRLPMQRGGPSTTMRHAVSACGSAIARYALLVAWLRRCLQEGVVDRPPPGQLDCPGFSACTCDPPRLLPCHVRAQKAVLRPSWCKESPLAMVLARYHGEFAAAPARTATRRPTGREPLRILGKLINAGHSRYQLADLPVDTRFQAQPTVTSLRCAHSVWRGRVLRRQQLFLRGVPRPPGVAPRDPATTAHHGRRYAISHRRLCV